MFTFLIILIAVLAIILTLVVLIQSGKGGGLAGIAAGGATQQVLGARQAPDILEKATWTLATLFIVLCLLTNFVIDSEEVPESVIRQRSGQEVAPPTLPPPADAPLQDEGATEGADVPAGTPEGEGTEGTDPDQ